MKNILKIAAFIIAFSFTGKMQAQLDTLAYLKKFEANKAKYVGQPMSKLLKDMTKIQPETVWFVPIPIDATKIKDSRFKFCEKEDSFDNAITLRITWKDYIPYSEVKYYHDKNKFYFTKEERSFYGKKIIEDIRVYR